MCTFCLAEGMLAGEMERVTLENTEPGHNKQYTLWIEEFKDGFRVAARYGPIGKWTKTVVKYLGPASLSMARSHLFEIHDQKVKKGYVRRICTGAPVQGG